MEERDILDGAFQDIGEEPEGFYYLVEVTLEHEDEGDFYQSSYVFRSRPDTVKLVKIKSQTLAQYKALFNRNPEEVSLVIEVNRLENKG